MLLTSPAGTRIGWRLTGWWRQAALGISAAGLSAAPVLGLHKLLQDLQLRHLYLRPRSLPAKLPEEHPLVPLFVGEEGWQWRAMLIVGACVILPILEETLFRGILYRALRRHWSFAPAAVGSAAIFAVSHLSWAGMVPYLLLGMVFAYLYERSGSLVAPWAAHGAFNGFNLAILLALFGWLCEGEGGGADLDKGSSAFFAGGCRHRRRRGAGGPGARGGVGGSGKQGVSGAAGEGFGGGEVAGADRAGGEGPVEADCS